MKMGIIHSLFPYGDAVCHTFQFANPREPTISHPGARRLVRAGRGLSLIPTRSGRTKNSSQIRGRLQMICCERRSSRIGMPSDEEVAEIRPRNVNVAIPYGSKEARKGANNECSIGLSRS